MECPKHGKTCRNTESFTAKYGCMTQDYKMHHPAFLLYRNCSTTLPVSYVTMNTFRRGAVICDKD